MTETAKPKPAAKRAPAKPKPAARKPAAKRKPATRRKRVDRTIVGGVDRLWARLIELGVDEGQWSACYASTRHLASQLDAGALTGREFASVGATYARMETHLRDEAARLRERSEDETPAIKGVFDAIAEREEAMKSGA